MQHGLLIGLTRLRLALMAAGLAFFLGLSVPAGIRALIFLLVLVAIVGDGAVEDQRTKIPAPRPGRDYDTAA
ncbi:hypothetical protein EST92_11690 [Streptomyces sp. TM32]|uniref:hypothetical protein n=1 Tax=Streptomyces sp. TM32 TaxID=1652669 RepID=UPI001010A06A|nr:hypothetical protein [Streptomyces sp. TM32]RXS84213.1 hypothetical protein EST92_11690 [Streptomyces sp. TM32]